MPRKIPSLASVLILFAAPCAAQTDARVDSLFAAWNTDSTPGAAVFVAQGGDIVFRRGYGIANLEYGVPVTASTVFLVASVSKQFTAFAVAMLAVEGRIGLDAPVTKYVPELPEFGITVRHLVHHTSGLRDEFGLLAMAGYRMDDVIDKRSVLSLLGRQAKLNFEPGEEYFYSNSGYTLLAEIVERVTGQSFIDCTRTHIFEPLGMEDSRFRDDRGSVIRNRAQGYVTSGDGYRSQLVSWSKVGASGLYTTAEDLARWVCNFDTGPVGGPAVLDLVHERGRLTGGDTLAYAFGQSVGTYRGFRSVSHSGSHRGFRSHPIRLPDKDLAVVVLSNLEEFAPADMARRVVDAFLPEDPALLSEYEGSYWSEELETTWSIAAAGSPMSTARGWTPSLRNAYIRSSLIG